MRYSPRSGFTLLQVVIVLAIVVILAALLFPVFSRSRGYDDNRPVCQTNLKQIMLGFKQYVQDYDEKYPPPATSQPEFGWAAVLQPYAKSKQMLQCDKELNNAFSDPTQPGYTDYWFNGRMAGLRESQVEHQAFTISLGDGDSNNAGYQLNSLPKAWRGDTSSPLYRHSYPDIKGANFAFADGHAKWFSADLWKNDEDLGQRGFTFRIDSK